MVDPFSDAFRNPTKFVGPVYGAKEAAALAESLGWTIKPDGEYFRRVVPSPPPLEILQVDAVRCLLENAPSLLPIACGGGGVPVMRVPSRPETLQGVEAVIDKDMCGSKLAIELEADGYIILTDGGGIFKVSLWRLYTPYEGLSSSMNVLPFLMLFVLLLLLHRTLASQMLLK